MPGMVDLRNAVKSLIESKKAANTFVYNTFEVAATYLPLTELHNFPADGKVWVIGMDFDDGPNKTRSNITLREVPVQIALQRIVAPTDVDLLDQMVLLNEQLRNEIIRHFDGNETYYSWLRNLSMRDPEGTPYSFSLLKDKGYFQAYFTAFFQYPLSPE